MRLLYWRREKPNLFDHNPWDDDVGLSGWVPTSERVDMMAMLASLAKAQWSLGQWLESVSRAQTFMSRTMFFCGVMWILVALANLANLYHWW